MKKQNINSHKQIHLFFRDQSALCLGSMLAKLANKCEKEVDCFSAAQRFAVLSLFGCLIGFAPSSFFASPIRAMLRGNPLETAIPSDTDYYVPAGY